MLSKFLNWLINIFPFIAELAETPADLNQPIVFKKRSAAAKQENIAADDPNKSTTKALTLSSTVGTSKNSKEPTAKVKSSSKSDKQRSKKAASSKLSFNDQDEEDEY